jgi:hypothetical protein
VARIETPLAQIRTGQASGRLDLFSTLDVDTVEIGGHEVALEAEPTAALAEALSESRFWQQELKMFLGDLLGVRGRAAIVGLRPYRAGRIPSVFVHGTASSAGRWADMVNDLIADPRLRHRYAFWFFRYDSGQPIAYSPFDPARLHQCLALLARNVGAIRLALWVSGGQGPTRDQLRAGVRMIAAVLRVRVAVERTRIAVG